MDASTHTAETPLAVLEAPADEPALPGLPFARCLLTPGLACAVLALRPESPWLLALAAALPFAIDSLGERTGDERRQPSPDLPGWPFALVLYLQFALHVANTILAMLWIGEVGWWSPATPVALLYLILSNGLTAAVGGHEQVHSRSLHRHLMGRLLYASFLHEHWCTEHLRGHHARFATADDPSTARFGETLFAYLRRTLPAQFASAWRIERRRHRRKRFAFLRNWVVQGLLLEAVLLGLVVWGFGLSGLAVFLIQAAWVTVLLHVVNYFEHWGLDRRLGGPGSWDATSASTLFSMVGLVRHADHHLHSRRPYQQLRYRDDSPKLPCGYGGSIFLALFRNKTFRALLEAELSRKGLLPAER